MFCKEHFESNNNDSISDINIISETNNNPDSISTTNISETMSKSVQNFQSMLSNMFPIYFNSVSMKM